MRSILRRGIFKKGGGLPMILMASLFLIGAGLIGTGRYELNEKASFVYLSGTSSLHDWKAESGMAEGYMKADVESKHIVDIQKAKVSVPVSSLKSGKDGMDENMHKALKGEKHPNIVFELHEETVHNGTITVKGDLTIGGVTKSVETLVSQKEVEGQIKIQGKMDIKMSEFDIKPPEFLFGSFKTGDEVNVMFYFMFRDPS